MSYYNHDVVLHPYGDGPDKGDVGIDTLMCHGYWEHSDGTEGGELLFEVLEDGRLELVDYDGAFEIPRPVLAALAAHGIVFDAETF